MKRFFFTAIALAAVAVSCTKSGLLESPQTYETPITFEPYTGKSPVTKASAVNIGDIATSGFRVFGFNEGTNNSISETEKANPTLKRVVTSADEGTNWTYQVPMYWQENQSMSFVAYGLNVNANKTVVATTGDINDANDTGEQNPFKKKSTDYTVFTYTVPGTVSAQKDLVISPMLVGRNSSNSSTPISINLHHVLSRVGFKLKSEGQANVDILIKNVTLRGKGLNTADFNLSTAVVSTTTGTGSTATTTISYANDATQLVEGNDKPVAVTGGTSIAYSLFDSAYSEETTGTNDFGGFIATSSSTSTTVGIWKNCYFKPGTALDEIELPEFDNQGKLVEPDEVEEGEEGYADYLKAKALYDMRTTSINSPYMMILPQTMTDAEIEVIYQMTGAEQQVATIDLGDFAFRAGKAYEFVFSVSTTTVGFGVQVGNWLSGLTDDGEAPDTNAEGYFPLS